MSTCLVLIYENYYGNVTVDFERKPEKIYKQYLLLTIKMFNEYKKANPLTGYSVCDSVIKRNVNG